MKINTVNCNIIEDTVTIYSGTKIISFHISITPDNIFTRVIAVMVTDENGNAN